MSIFKIFKQKWSFFQSWNIIHSALLREWRKAVQNGYITFYLQPKYSFTDEKMVGAEALIRWNHPTKGPIAPSEFIPLAEKRGLIQMIDTWMLESVINQMGIWNKLGLTEPFQISVNVSADTIQSSHFIKSIKKALRNAEILPNQLEIEI